MIEFSLENIVGSSNWWRVTGGMAMDEIEYKVQTDDDVYVRSDSLIALLKLYECARYEISTSNYPEEVWFDITELQDGIVVSRRNTDVRFETSYSELQSSLKELLKHIFNELDGMSTDEDKIEAFEYVEAYLSMDFEDFYNQIVSN